jgi:hypothetical protein
MIRDVSLTWFNAKLNPAVKLHFAIYYIRHSEQSASIRQICPSSGFVGRRWSNSTRAQHAGDSIEDFILYWNSLLPIQNSLGLKQ